MIILEQGQESPVSDVLNEVLVCPLDHADLRVERGQLVCVECGARFDVEDGVPNMLPNDDE